ncbi:MAG: hypothetical protein K1X57_16910 [Gemmataceae bacterium]|nr:hypothetical protein [Gemmataceae bacterium]
MKKSVTYEWFSVGTVSNDVPSLPPEDQETLVTELMCCDYPKTGLTAIDGIINKARLIHFPLSGLLALDLPLVHEQWLELLPRSVVEEEAYVGKVLTADGQPVNGWVSFRPRHRTFDRGEPRNVIFDRCPRCKRALYWGPPDWYLSKHLTPGVRLFGGSICNVIVHHSLIHNLYKRKHWKKYSIVGREVIDPPLDGITENFEITF